MGLVIPSLAKLDQSEESESVGGVVEMLTLVSITDTSHLAKWSILGFAF